MLVLEQHFHQIYPRFYLDRCLLARKSPKPPHCQCNCMAWIIFEWPIDWNEISKLSKGDHVNNKHIRIAIQCHTDTSEQILKGQQAHRESGERSWSRFIFDADLNALNVNELKKHSLLSSFPHWTFLCKHTGQRDGSAGANPNISVYAIWNVI